MINNSWSRSFITRLNRTVFTGQSVPRQLGGASCKVKFCHFVHHRKLLRHIYCISNCRSRAHTTTQKPMISAENDFVLWNGKSHSGYFKTKTLSLVGTKVPNTALTHPQPLCLSFSAMHYPTMCASEVKSSPLGANLSPSYLILIFCHMTTTAPKNFSFLWQIEHWISVGTMEGKLTPRGKLRGDFSSLQKFLISLATLPIWMCELPQQQPWPGVKEQT